MNASHRRPAPAGFTVLELLVGAAAGALILAALARSLAVFGQHVELVRGDSGTSPDDAVALMCDLTRHAWWVDDPQPDRLELTDASGALTVFALEGSALRVVRPSGAEGVLLSGVEGFSVSTETVARLRDAEPLHDERTWWAADVSGIDPDASPDLLMAESGLPVALGFTMSSAVPESYDALPEVDEHALYAALGSLVVPLSYLGTIPDDPNAPFTGDGEDGGKGKDKKVVICHVPPGNPDNAHTIEVAESAVAAHLDHGDSLGSCEPGGGGPSGGSAELVVELFRARAPDDARPHGPSLGALSIPAGSLPPASAVWVLSVPGTHDEHDHSADECGATTSDGKVIVCHVPPGNPGNAHAIEIAPAAVSAHLAHGDYLGCCGDHDDTTDVYTLEIEWPSAATVIDLSSLGTIVEPGVAYTLVLRLEGPGTLNVGAMPLPSAQNSGVAQAALADGPLQAVASAVDFQLAGSQAITQTERHDCVRRVSLALEMADGQHVGGSAGVANQIGVPNTWFGVASSESQELEP